MADDTRDYTKQDIYRSVLDIGFRGKLDELGPCKNIAALMSQADCNTIGLWAKTGYEEDKQSRSKWEQWYAEAIKLALQVKEAKSYPWQGSSNVKFPLLTIACLNAHAQAYPVLISGDNVVKCRVIGTDEKGEKGERAVRVGSHMSFQLLETMPWEEQTDKQILVHYLLGTTFKKTFRDNARRKNCSDLVMPQDLVVNYWATDMDTAPRLSHTFPLTKNELWTNINAQVYSEPTEPIRTENRPTGPLEAAKDKSQLTQPTPAVELVNFLVEQCCWMDLDQDGYDEPYAVTFDEQTGFVYRILARYLSSDIKRDKEGRVITIDPENYYTKFVLIPSPDGGFYGMGLGRFLAPINDAVDTLINQMIDGIHFTLLGGGFLGRGAKIKPGEHLFKPREWKQIDGMGDDIRKNILPYPSRDVPAVALDLLKYLVDYGERVGSSGDIQMGKLPGQNTKAETASIANENGKMIFNATFKRFWRGLKEEFKKLYKLNQRYQDDEAFQIGEKQFRISKADYDFPDAGIVPAADPNIISKSDRRQTAMFVMQTAQGLGWAGHDQEKVIKRLYQAFDVADVDSFYVGLKQAPPQPHPKMLELQVKAQREKTRELDIKHKAQLAVANLQLKAKESAAKVLKMMAEVGLLMKEAQGIEIGHKIALLQMHIDAELARRDDVLETVKLLMDAIDKDTPDGSDNAGGMGNMAAAPNHQSISPVPTPA